MFLTAELALIQYNLSASCVGKTLARENEFKIAQFSVEHIEFFLSFFSLFTKGHVIAPLSLRNGSLPISNLVVSLAVKIFWVRFGFEKKNTTPLYPMKHRKISSPLDFFSVKTSKAFLDIATVFD